MKKSETSRHAFGPDRKYEVTEIGLIPFIRKYINEDFRSYTLIPVFISRTFRQRNIFVHSGGCDALITAITPRAFLEGNPKIKQLFPDARAAEQNYYRNTRIFPIMHVVAIRTDVIEANRKELELVMRYTHEQGLVKRRLKFEELFHPSTLTLEENMG